MLKNFNPTTGAPIPIISGQFTADAMLTATFGQVDVDGEGTIPVSMLNTITGTVSDFMNADGEMIDAGWTLDLDGDITDNAGTFTGTTSADVDGDDMADSDMGAFAGTFHGADDTTTTTVTEFPALLRVLSTVTSGTVTSSAPSARRFRTSSSQRSWVRLMRT